MRRMAIASCEAMRQTWLSPWMRVSAPGCERGRLTVVLEPAPVIAVRGHLCLWTLRDVAVRLMKVMGETVPVTMIWLMS